MKKPIPRLISATGYLGLVFFTIWLFLCSFLESCVHHPLPALLKGLVLIGLVYEMVRERKHLPGARTEILDRKDILNFLAVFSGALITFFLSVDLGLGAVVASGAAGIFGAVFIKKYAAPFFCGSFVGMASSEVFVSLPCIALAGFIGGIFFVAATGVFDGFGGKLGTIAFGGCLAASLLLRSPLHSLAVPGWEVGWIIVLYSVLAAVITFVISIRFKAGPVAASGIVGVIAGLALPLIHGAALGETLAVMAFCASFAGMSGTNRLFNELHIALAGIFCGLVFIYSSPYLSGAGGKLGTIAFGSVIAVRGLANLLVLSYRGYRARR